jgi:hypothetical protein
MSSHLRSSSVGAVPHVKPLSRSRAESSHASPLEVRCACQFFQSDSLIPERINPIGSRPPSRVGEVEKAIECSKNNFVGNTVVEENLSGSVLSFGKVSVPDYYAETNLDYRVGSNEDFCFNQNKENEQLSLLSQPLSFDTRSIPSIEIESFRREFPIANLGQNINPPSQPEVGSFRGRFSSQNISFSSQNVIAKAPTQINVELDERKFPTVNVNQSGPFGRRFSSQNISQTEVGPPRRQLSSQNINRPDIGSPVRNFNQAEVGSIGRRSPVRSSNRSEIISVDRSPPRNFNQLETEPINRFTIQNINQPDIGSVGTNSPVRNLNQPAVPPLHPRFPSQNIIPPTPPPKQVTTNMKGQQFSSQKSLDRYSTSALLNKYRPKSQSVAPSLQGSAVDVRVPIKMSKTVSFDYGKPTHSKNSLTNENLNFDQYHRMSPMVFPIRDRLQKLERMHDSR